MKATRERKLKFLLSGGRRFYEDAIARAIFRIGEEHFLTDEQLDEILEYEVQSARSDNRRMIRDRKRYSG